MIYLCITPFFPTPDHFGGPFIYDQVRAIERTKRFGRVVVLRPTNYQTKENFYDVNGIRVHLFKTLNFPSYSFPGFFDAINTHNFFECLRRIGITPNDIEVVHAHVYPCFAHALKKKNHKIKAVMQYHGADPFDIRLGKLNNFKWHRKIVANYNKKWCGKMDLIIAISNKVLSNIVSFPLPSSYDIFDDYTDRLKGLENLSPAVINNSYILNNGVDLSIFYPEVASKK